MNVLDKFKTRVSRHGFWPTVAYSADHVINYRMRHALRRLRGRCSQSGEDKILDRLMGHKRRGFYLDIGANDPVEWSNTFGFYRRGWSGVNVEPNPAMAQKLRTARPCDLTFQVAMTSEAAARGKTLTLYLPPHSSAATLSPQVAKALEGWEVGADYMSTVPVQVEAMTMSELGRRLDWPQFDFCSMDVESHEFEVLGANDWTRLRPRVFCIEVILHPDGIMERFMKTVGYKLVAAAPFKDSRRPYYINKNHDEFYADTGGPMR